MNKTDENYIANYYDHAAYAQKQLVEKGLNKEWEVVVATDYTLQLDYDSDNELLCVVEPPEIFWRVLEALESMAGPVDYAVTRSKGGNIHVTITMREPMHITMRVAWQAIFGSDPIREVGHLQSIVRNEVNPILLYERKKLVLNSSCGALVPVEKHCQICNHYESNHFSCEMGSFCKYCDTKDNVWEHVFEEAK